MVTKKLVHPQSLQKLELCICFITWISIHLYAVYHVYLAGKLFELSDINDGFEDGWFLGFKKDMSDFEWQIWIPTLKSLMPWYLFHIFLTEFIRFWFIEALPICHALFTNLILYKMFGIEIMSLLFLNILLYYIALRARSRMLIWILTAGFILFLSFGFPHVYAYFEVHYTTQYCIGSFTSWLLLKCASYCFEFLRDSTSVFNRSAFVSLLGYCYYFPMFFLGPIMLYDEYSKGVKQKFRKWTLKRLILAVINILRFLMWFIVLDIFLHIFYIYALEYNVEEVKKMGAWYLNGLCYLLGSFFTSKYVVLYGLIGVIASIESNKPPLAPMCSYIVYRNSQMWRKFDVGYYQFVKRYIYIPTINESKSFARILFGAAVTFTFVFFWHGINTNTFIWCFFNFIEVAVIESTLSKISRNEKFCNFVVKNIGKKNIVRLAGLIYGPLYLIYVIINAFFYSPIGGFTYFSQFLEGNWSLIVILNISCYTFSITGMYINDYLERTKYYSKKYI